MHNISLSQSEAIEMMFDDPRLGVVILFTEACVLWDKSRRQVEYAIWNDKIIARKAITQGGWLISYESCVELWGQPELSLTEWIIYNGSR